MIKSVRMPHLFIYGTLIAPKVQHDIIGRVVPMTADSLPGYKKSSLIIDGVEYPVAIPHPPGTIEGMMIDITDEELAKIDEYETTAYQRVMVELSSGESAWFYAKSPDEDETE